jgi:hypothetical protein
VTRFPPPPPAYGARGDPGKGTADVGADSRLALRARPALALTGLVFFALPVAIYAGIGGRAFVRALQDPRMILMCAFGLVAAVQGVWLLLFPVMRTGPEGLSVRTFVLRPAARHPRSALVWRRNARWVGRFLLARGSGRHGRRIPMWTLTRRSQERLFAWLDATAEEAARIGRRIPRAHR